VVAEAMAANVREVDLSGWRRRDEDRWWKGAPNVFLLAAAAWDCNRPWV